LPPGAEPRPPNEGAQGAPRREELDWVARWILDEDLAAARSLDDLATAPHPLSSEPLNGRVEIGNDDK
jgi:hypothetical protein